MKKLQFNSVPFEIIAAFVTWLALLTITLYSLLVLRPEYHLRWIPVSLLMVIFIVSFLQSTSDKLKFKATIRKVHLSIQIASAVALYFIVPINYLPILATIWCAQLPRTFKFAHCIAIAGIVSIPVFFSVGYYWQSGSGLVSALVFWMFNAFAVVTMDRAVKEEQAREKATELNRELIATQSLLTEASRQSERLRISRNIHDVVGHHLTALTINLQVAAHLSSGKAKVTIEQCHGVAKLLLSDVRDAVSEMRDKSTIDVPGALHRLFDNIPGLQIHFDYDERLNIVEVALAEVVVRVIQEALTNALKHAHAQNVWIKVDSDGDKALSIEVKNDGCNSDTITVGNGLKGMKERVEELDGELYWDANSPYFTLKLRCPRNNDN